ncbi:MAG: hypothetical protein Q8K60_04395, partial [Parachlamydiaceae bacterium]|nr:hypothetical protein [Parachlamydiaceae bacterium]
MITDNFYSNSPQISLNPNSSVILDNLNSSTNNEMNTLLEESPLNFFFSEADQRLMKLSQAGFCNIFGKLNETHQSLSLCPDFNDGNPFKLIIQEIYEILNSYQRILKRVLEVPNQPSIHISIVTTLNELFTHLIECFSKEGQEKANQKLPFHLLEMYLIGSSVLPLIGINYFEKLALYHFSTLINGQRLFSENEIKNWFQNDKTKKLFIDQSNDLDTRIVISSNAIDHLGQISNALLTYVAEKIPDYSITPPYGSPPNCNLKAEYLLSTEAIRHRKIVREDVTRYAIIAFNTANKPIDFNCVGSTFNPKTNQLQSTLEYSHLSSLNSLTIPLFQFLSSSKPIKKMTFHSDYGIQLLLDILFDCSTPTTYNHYGWRHFLRKNIRMLGPDNEKNMIKEILIFRSQNDFKSISRHHYLPSKKDQMTLGGFLYLLLANDFSKFDAKIPHEPYQISEFLFRACQSLSSNEKITDDDFLKLWNCVDEYYWQARGCFSKSDSIYTALKEAILDDHVPFSINSAFIKILAYLFDPESATTHCNQPIIDLKAPFSALLPITLLKDVKTLNQYFLKHPFPNSFQKIYVAFARSSNFSFKNFPLTIYNNIFVKDPNSFKKIIKFWVRESNCHLKLIGLHLYLATYPCGSDYNLLIDILQNLPTFFQYIETNLQKNSLIKSILKIVQDDLPEAISLLEGLTDFNFTQLNNEQWMTLLIETKSSFSTKIAFNIFKNNNSYNIVSEKISLKLLNETMKVNFHHSCQLYLLVLQQQQLTCPDTFF